MKTVLITGNEKDFDIKLAEVFSREGYRVLVAGELAEDFCEPLDFFLDTTDYRDAEDNFTILDGINGEAVERSLRKNVLHSMALLERFLPMLDKGEGKRLFYLTAAEASINENRSTKGFGYAMSKAGLHQFLQLTRNKLAAKGYTFRVFDPMTGEASAQMAAEAAFHYITRRRGTENHDPLRDDEENLVFRDAAGRQHSW